ncbi:MAG: lytic transglycosylase domain-containing protein [Elusimicrobiota bacterium]|jgi:soluble lytic murein transglycosylase-like protein
MRETLERARMQSDAVGPADPALNNANRWQAFFDGEGRRAPIDDERILAAMREQGVPSRIVRTVLDEARRQEADPILVLSVIKQESGFDPRQRSPKGARGLMQIMPGTGRDLGVRSVKKLYDPQINVRAGVTYLKDMFEQFSNVSIEDLSAADPSANESVRAALAAYNAGPHAVEKHQGVPPYRQTRAYVERVLEYYRDFTHLLLVD